MDVWNLRGRKLRFLSEAQADELHDKSLQLLKRTGCVFKDEQALSIFSDAGAEVDRARQLVRIPPRLVEDALACCPRRVVLAARNPKYDVILEDDRVYFGTSTLPINVMDLDSGRVRRAVPQDCLDFPRLVDALPYIHFYKATIYPGDLQPDAAVPWMIYGGFANTEKEISVTPFTVDAAMTGITMAEIIAGGTAELKRRPLILYNVLSTAPLAWNAATVQILVKLAKMGMPTIIGAEPQAGTTAPITLLAATLLQNAETLAGITLAQIVNPGLPVIMGAIGSISDMRNGNFCSGAVELGLMNSVAAQMSQRYGIPLYATGGMSDAKVPDIQAGYEKGIQALLTALSGGNYIHDAAGMLDHCLTLGYEQYVIDNEILGMVARALSGINFGDEFMALDLIHKVGPMGNFLREPHTLKHLRSEQYLPTLANRKVRADWEDEGSPALVDLARGKARQILATHHPAPLPEDVHRELRQLAERRMPATTR